MIASDPAPLHLLVDAMLAAGGIHALRDPTRGGLAASLCEVASTAGIGVEIRATVIPVQEQVKAACELLGLDPLFVANEGKLVAFVPAACADDVLCRWKRSRRALVADETSPQHRGMSYPHPHDEVPRVLVPRTGGLGRRAVPQIRLHDPDARRRAAAH